MENKKVVTVKLLKWQTVKLTPQDKESVKALKEKLEAFKGSESSPDEQKLIYAGKVFVNDKKALFRESRSAAVLMATNQQKKLEEGSLIYVEWPQDERDSLLRLLISKITKSPGGAESKKEDPPSNPESKEENPPSNPESKKDNALPNPESKKDNALPNPESEKETPEKDLPPKAKIDLEKLPLKDELGKLIREAGFLEALKQLRKDGSNGSIDNEPPYDDKDKKLTVNNVFEFIGEFVGSGDTQEFNLHKNNKCSFSLSEDKIVKTIKLRLNPVVKLISNIRSIEPLKSKL